MSNAVAVSAAAEGNDQPLCVLKFGSSVLEREDDYVKVALEIFRHVRDGEAVVAVVSALASWTSWRMSVDRSLLTSANIWPTEASSGGPVTP